MPQCGTKNAAAFPSNASAGGGGGPDDDASNDGDGEDDCDDEAPTGTGRSAHNRLTSADLWNLGAVTADAAHALVKEKRDAQVLKEQA